MTTILEIFILLILIAFLLFLLEQMFNTFFRGFAPFISTRPKMIAKILDEIELRDGTIVYELGCGKAGFLRAARKRNKNIKLVGFENSLIPYTIGQIQNILTASKLEIRKKNFLNIDLGKVDIVYCYLNEKTMGKLEEKFKKECKSGATVASYQVPLKNTEADKELVVSSNEKVYFYKY